MRKTSKRHSKDQDAF